MSQEDSSLLNNTILEARPCMPFQKLCFGLGHVYNDLCAAVWFSYTLFYLQIVLQMESTTAGTLLVLGQIVDAVATPAAGLAMDRIGTKKAWHMAGTVAVAIGFSLLFCIKPTDNYWWVLLNFGGLIALFQIGWATVQISHLSIIPVIARDHNHSSDLTTIRYTASVSCGITVYIITWAILKNNQVSNKIGPNDYDKFRELAFVVSILGLVATFLFYTGIDWKHHDVYETITDNPDDNKNSERQNGNLTPSHFLKTAGIYQVSLLYMASRLFTILNLIYIPLYLDERQSNLNIDTQGIRQAVAIVPLVSFVASFLTSLILKCRTQNCSDKLSYFIGSVLSLAGCLWIGIGISPGSHAQIYGVACFIGMGSSATMVSSLCLTAEFVQSNGFKGGSVYSTVTFADKLMSGGIVLVTQHLQCQPKESCPNFYSNVLTFVCGAAVILGLLSLTTLQYKSKRFSPSRLRI